MVSRMQEQLHKAIQSSACGRECNEQCYMCEGTQAPAYAPLVGGTWTVIDQIIIPNAYGSLLGSRSEAADSVPTARQRPWRAQKETGGKNLMMRARDRTELIG